MDLVVCKGDGWWPGVKNNTFWLIGPGDLTQQVGIEADGTPQPFEQIVGDWGWLPYGALPAAEIDRWVGNSVAAYVRNAKLTKSLVDVTLP